MSYDMESLSKPIENLNRIVVDLRSDTVSKPSKAMRMAMLEAEVGDDVFEEDPTVEKLEKKAANLVGKESAIFVPSGSMSNLIAIMIHCNERGSEAYCGEESHVYIHEQGSAAQFGGVTMCSLPNNPDGTFELSNLRKKLKQGKVHETISKLIIVENANNGKVLPQNWINSVGVFAKENQLKLHMDGARLWNASVANGISGKDIVADFDSVTFCLSKGLGAPVGSMLCGTRDFVSKARRIRKGLGGGMRQVGILAAAGLVALDQMLPLLEIDHKRTALIARAIFNLNSIIFTVDLKYVQTNMIFLIINSKNIKSGDVVRRLSIANDDCEDDKIIVKCMGLTNSSVRFVVYYEITDEMVDAACRKIIHVLKTFDPDVEKKNF